MGWFALKAREGADIEKLEIGVKKMLAERHHIHPDDKLAIGSFNLKKEFDRFQGLFLGIKTLIWIVGIGTLLAGVVGISNIMLIVIKERTKEIGIRRAIGATPSSIISQIILESVFLTGLAGYLGLFLGIWLIEGVNQALAKAPASPDGAGAMFKNPGIDLGVALLSLFILVVCGILAGLVPASKAVSVRPVDAIRDE
ncbi:MAG: ABC transporter permease [Cytophagales bacterium]|nr:ABC transporter permease [Cytophagales bacterium]